MAHLLKYTAILSKNWRIHCMQQQNKMQLLFPLNLLSESMITFNIATMKIPKQKDPKEAVVALLVESRIEQNDDASRGANH
mmetsp:Transcript_3332/g.5121  ORF Transcript_3332/g.5121 Transcript_3332/m.5121 type:complete len:81 (-) Transcript_3332:1345-1587(-)